MYSPGDFATPASEHQLFVHPSTPPKISRIHSSVFTKNGVRSLNSKHFPASHCLARTYDQLPFLKNHYHRLGSIQFKFLFLYVAQKFLHNTSSVFCCLAYKNGIICITKTAVLSIRPSNIFIFSSSFSISC